MEKLLEIYFRREKAVRYLLSVNKGQRAIQLEERLMEISRVIYEIKKLT